MTPENVVIRAYIPSNDEAFISHSWRRMFRDTRHWKRLPDDVYHIEKRAQIARIIANPLSTESRLTVQACDLLLGRDPHGMAWIKTHRK